jgi:hypothetical protein
MKEFKDRYHFDEAHHVHILDDRPLTGTSSVMDVVAKPLTWWASAMAVGVLGWTNPKLNHIDYRREKAEDARLSISNLNTDAYLKLLDSAYSAHATKLKSSAKKGKDLHTELEEYVKFCIDKFEGRPVAKDNVDQAIYDFAHWSIGHVYKFKWSEMHTFSEKEWLGGISDCGAELLGDDRRPSGQIAIIDFKSSKDAYASQFLQIAGYAIQIAENGGFTRKGDQMVEPTRVDQFIVIPFGAPEFKVVVEKDTPAFEQGFRSALNLYRLTQEFDKKS